MRWAAFSSAVKATRTPHSLHGSAISASASSTDAVRSKQTVNQGISEAIAAFARLTSDSQSSGRSWPTMRFQTSSEARCSASSIPCRVATKTTFPAAAFSMATCARSVVFPIPLPPARQRTVSADGQLTTRRTVTVTSYRISPNRRFSCASVVSRRPGKRASEIVGRSKRRNNVSSVKRRSPRLPN